MSNVLKFPDALDEFVSVIRESKLNIVISVCMDDDGGVHVISPEGMQDYVVLGLLEQAKWSTLVTEE